MNQLKSDLIVLNDAIAAKIAYWYDLETQKVLHGVVVAVEYSESRERYVLLIQENNTGTEYSIPLRVCEFE